MMLTTSNNLHANMATTLVDHAGYVGGNSAEDPWSSKIRR